MENTKIDWCDSTWNPVTGCLHGCKYCYARGIVERFKSRKDYEIDESNNSFIFSFNGTPPLYELKEPCYAYHIEDFERKGTKYKLPYPYGFKPTFHRYKLYEYEKKQGRNIFVCSMADLFGAWVPDSWIEEVFAACEKAPQHNYLFLTKNPGRYVELAVKGILKCSDNMWYGSTITSPDMAAFFSEDHKTFWSIEPILEPFEMEENKKQLPNWIIVGAETGRRKGKVIPRKEWIERIADQCRKTNTPVFMKSSLEEIWGKELLREYPKGLQKN